MNCTCPLCGAPIAELLPIDALLAAPIAPTAKKCLDALYRLHPKTISLNRLADIVYQGDAAGGPEDAPAAISMSLYSANKVLKHTGWRMGASRHGKRDDIGLRPIQ